MNKDELLKKAQEENKGYDERDLINIKQAGAASAAVGCALCMIISLVYRIVEGIDPLVGITCWLIYCGMNAAGALFKAIHIRKKLFTVSAVLYGVLFIAFAALFVIELIKR